MACSLGGDPILSSTFSNMRVLATSVAHIREQLDRFYTWWATEHAPWMTEGQLGLSTLPKARQKVVGQYAMSAALLRQAEHITRGLLDQRNLPVDDLEVLERCRAHMVIDAMQFRAGWEDAHDGAMVCQKTVAPYSRS